MKNLYNKNVAIVIQMINNIYKVFLGNTKLLQQQWMRETQMAVEAKLRNQVRLNLQKANVLERVE